MRFPLALSLAAACLVPVETTWSFVASAQEAPAPTLPPLPPTDGAPLPPAPTPSPPAKAGTITVHIVTNAGGLQFLFRPAPASSPSPSTPGVGDDMHLYTASCLAPCDLELPPGDYVVALSKSGGKPSEQATPLSLRSPTTLEGLHESHSGARVTGIVLFSTLVPIGVLLAVAGATNTTSSCDVNPGFNECSTNPDTGLLATGLLAIGIGAVLGTVLILQHDKATVQVVQATGPLAFHGGPSEHPSGANGLALRVTF